MFFASQKSVSDSVDCAHELELARKYKLQIIPIKGANVKWRDLKSIGLSRDLGYEFEKTDFQSFCENLHNYIMKLKREINLFDPEKAKIDRDMLNLKNTIIKVLDSSEFKVKFKENWEQFAKLFQELSNGKITTEEYILRFAQNIKKKNEKIGL